MEKMLIVYKAYFENSNKCYIGITNNLENRKAQHLKDANFGSDRKFCKAIRKYGEPIFEILEFCENISQLYEAEKKYIQMFDSFKNGYNSTLGGEGSFGSPRPKNEKWKSEHSRRMTGSKNPRFGIKLDENFREKHSERMRDYYKNNPSKKAWGNKSLEGMMWINNGESDRLIRKNESIPVGFSKGRIFRKRKRNKNANLE